MQSKIIKHLMSNSNVFKIKGLIALYLYGSLISGRLREESDIDIAILPSYTIIIDERLELISKVEGSISSLLKKIDIKRDLSILDLRGKHISLVLQYKIITEGILLHENNKEERLEFENAIKGEYFDFVPFIKSLRETQNSYRL